MTAGPTLHEVREGDARDLSTIGTESVHLVCTSPPYGSLKEYPDRVGQLGNLPVYDEFLDELDKVWKESLRVLVPGGRIACVVGDVCISRRKGGRHHVLTSGSKHCSEHTVAGVRDRWCRPGSAGIARDPDRTVFGNNHD